MRGLVVVQASGILPNMNSHSTEQSPPNAQRVTWRTVVRTVWYYTGFWVYQLLVFPFMFVVLCQKALGRDEVVLAMLKKQIWGWTRFTFWLSGVKVHVVGAENLPEKGPAYYVSNHQGAMDIPLLLYIIRHPVGFVAKIELKKLPLMSTWMKLIGCRFLDRKDPRKAIDFIKLCVRDLNEGRSLIVFPEGTRSKGPEMLPFHKGSLRPVVTADVWVVPVAICDSWKRREALGGWMTPGSVTVSVLPPVYTGDLSREARKNLGDTLRERIQEEVWTYEQGLVEQAQR